MVLEAYVERSNPALVAAVELGGIRTFLSVPMLKDDELIGYSDLPPGGPSIH